MKFRANAVVLQLSSFLRCREVLRFDRKPLLAAAVSCWRCCTFLPSSLRVAHHFNHNALSICFESFHERCLAVVLRRAEETGYDHGMAEVERERGHEGLVLLQDEIHRIVVSKHALQLL